MLFSDIEQLSEQLMARLSSIPNFEGRSILLEDPTTKNHKLGSKQIEVRCVYLEELLGKSRFSRTSAFRGLVQ